MAALEADEFFKKFIDVIIQSSDKVEIVALKRLEGLFKRRIFNQSLTTAGNSLGIYKSKAWAKKRAKAGRQIRVKDLEFEGDLRRSIQVGKQDGRNVLEFNTLKRALIAEGNEKHIGVVIFTPSDDEVDEMVDAYLDEMFIQLNKKIPG